MRGGPAGKSSWWGGHPGLVGRENLPGIDAVSTSRLAAGWLRHSFMNEMGWDGLGPYRPWHLQALSVG